MTVEKIMDSIKELKPSSFGAEFIMKTIEELDRKIFEEFLKERIENPENYDNRYPFENEKEELLLPEIYANVYISYVMAQMDFFQGDYDRYNNEMLMYNTKLIEYYNWYTRTHQCKEINITIS